MKGKTLLSVMILFGILAILSVAVAFALESGEFTVLVSIGQYQEVVSMCNKHAAEIATHPDKAEILAACAQAKQALGMSDAPAVPDTPPEAPATTMEDVFAAPPEPEIPETPDVPEPTMPSGPGSGISSSEPPGGAPPPAVRVVKKSDYITVDMFMTPLRAKQFDQVVDLCDKYKNAIASSDEKDAILRACGEAKMGSYETSRKQTSLTSGMKDLEKSLKARYDNTASYDLGMSRLLTIDTIPKQFEKLDEERKAILEMWEAIMMRHAVENFNPAVSDLIIIWVIGNPNEQKPGYADMLIGRVIKNQDNISRERWLAARIRMLTDRFYNIDPQKGENEVRQGNLEILKTWMQELHDLSYFDNNVLVGMLTYKANRHQEKYDQTDETEEEFHKALYYYDEALTKARSKKAMAVLHQKIGFLCSRYRSTDKDRLIEFYKKGFLHARRGLLLMNSVNSVRQESGKAFYRYEQDSSDVTAELQNAYGNNLTGYIYQLYLDKNYKGVVGLKKYTLDVAFDWESKFDVLLIFAESAKQLASDSLNNEVLYRRYKEMCLAGANRAFKYILKRYGGKPPASYDENFCKVFNAYWNYLDGFGQLIQAKALENRFGTICPAGGGAPAAAAPGE